MSDLNKLKEIDYSDIPIGYRVIIMGLIEQVEAAEAELARRDAAAGEPVLYALRFKNSQGVPNREINDNCLFRSYEKARAYGLGGNFVTQPDGKIERVPNPALDPEVIPLYTEQPPVKAAGEPAAYIHESQISRIKAECGVQAWLHCSDKKDGDIPLYTAPQPAALPPKDFVVNMPAASDRHQCISTACNAAENYKADVIESIKAAGGSIADE